MPRRAWLLHWNACRALTTELKSQFYIPIKQSFDSLVSNFADEPSAVLFQEVISNDLPEDWYGLEYTLELSRRDRRGSKDHPDISAGEHSKVYILNPLLCLDAIIFRLKCNARAVNPGQSSIKALCPPFWKTRSTTTG